MFPLFRNNLSLLLNLKKNYQNHIAKNINKLLQECSKAYGQEQQLQKCLQLYKLRMGSKRTLQRQLQKVNMKKVKKKFDMDNMLNKGQLWNKIYDEPKEIEQLAVSDEDIVEYIRITLRHMVDDVILYNERLKTGQANICLASVPQAKEAEDIRYKSIQNEGKFGWCILCKQPAFYFVKSTCIFSSFKEKTFRNDRQYKNYVEWIRKQE